MQSGRVHPGYYLVLSAIIGGAVLGLEVLAARTLAPYIGSGPVVWACLLAVALAGISIGNLAGGVLTQRCFLPPTLIWSLWLAASWLVVFSQYYSCLIGWAAGMPLVTGALIAVCLVQLAPMVMFGLNVPLLLEAGEGNMRKGIWHGLVLACGSVGGIAGALVLGLTMLPLVGLAKSFLAISIVLVASIVPLVLMRRTWWEPVVTAGILAVAAVYWIRSSNPSVIQSQHGQLEVRFLDHKPVLVIDGMQQTAFIPSLEKWEAQKNGYMLETALMVRSGIRNSLVVGLGAGLAPRILEKHGITCDSVESDPQVVELARQPFGFTGTVSVADGRTFLRQTDRKWNLIFLDVCTSDRLPWHLFTIEAIKTARARLEPSGILVMQFIGDNGSWSASVLKTVKTVFKEVVLIVPADNFAAETCWLFAADDSLEDTNRGICQQELCDLLSRKGLKLIKDPEKPGDPKATLLSDDLFREEFAWARTALQWRRSCRASF